MRRTRKKKGKGKGDVRKRDVRMNVDEMRRMFKKVTDERNDDVVRFFLESSSYDLERAVTLWSEQDEDEILLQQTMFKEDETTKEEDTTNKADDDINSPTTKATRLKVLPETPPRTTTTTTTTTRLQVRCCICGVQTDANESNKCLACLVPDIDLKKELLSSSKEAEMPTIIQCRNCLKYQNRNKIWIHCDWESADLLQLCLKEVKAFRKNRSIKLIDASFVYTEPHSKRVKAKLVVQKEITADIESSTPQFFRQTVILNFKIRFNMCGKCARESANETQNWEAVTQIRQHHRHASTKTLSWIEQKILNADAHVDAVGVRNVSSGTGLDIFWAKSRQAKHFLDFMKKNVPCRVSTTKTLISHDVKSNTHRYQYTHRIDVVPLSRYDLVWIDSKKSSLYGDITRGLSIVTSVAGSTVRLSHVTEHNKTCDVPALTLWKHPLHPVVSLERDSTERFLILDVLKNVLVVSPADSVDASKTFSCVASCFHVKDGDDLIGRHVRGYFLKNRTDLSDLVDGDDALIPDAVLIDLVV